jgi:hypothetical protein
MLEVMNGTIPMQASEAVKALGNQIDSDLLSLYKLIYGVAGTAATTPFGSSVAEATEARKVLNNQLCPLDSRRIVLNADAEANALGLRAFADLSFTGDPQVIMEGNLNRRLGFDWFMDQNVKDHTVGTFGGTVGDPSKVNGVVAAGLATLSVDVGASNDMAINKGDVFYIAGDTQPYVVTSATTGTAASAYNVPIAPVLTGATSGNEALTLIGSADTAYSVNLAFHRDAIAFATRPLMDSAQGLGNLIQSAVDPISGIALRLEVSREHKRTRFSYDILYGFQLVRAQLACRIHG